LLKIILKINKEKYCSSFKIFLLFHFAFNKKNMMSSQRTIVSYFIFTEIVTDKNKL